MPLLDVSFVLLDPMLADTFNVRRRLAIVNDLGREMAVPDQLFTDEIGVITQMDPADLIRMEDGVSLPRRIFIASQFQFIALSDENQPDEIEWNDTIYTVESSLPYSRYGAGFYEATALYRGPVPPVQ